MSLSREAMLELMALADGELEGEERARAERLAAENEDARRVLESMRSPALGSFVGEAFAQRAGAADGIADAVMAKLAGGGAGAETGGVVRLADARARQVSRGPRLQVAIASGLAALAIAAAIALWAQSRDMIEMGAPVASVGVPVPSLAMQPSSTLPTAQSARPLAQEGTHVPGVEVDEIDSPQHDVHVFEIPVGAAPSAAAAAHATAPSSVVIMIEDQPGGGGQ